MPRKKKPAKRGESKHPGVVIVKGKTPGGKTRWRARYKDPETGKTRWQSLDALGYTNDAGRREWAKQKAETLSGVRAEMQAGVRSPTHTSPEDAVEGFLDSCEGELRAQTVATYRRGLARFLAAATETGLHEIENLNGPRLVEIRDRIVSAKRMVPAASRKRGARAKTRKARSPATSNRELRTLKVALNHWRRRGMLPILDRDAISDSLKPVKAEKPRPVALATTAIRKILKAATRHDEERFKMTRAELRSNLPGCTPRNDPIAPFVAFVLLTGCRVGEALALKWEDVDLDAPDEDGKPVGEILLKATATKTRETRVVDLAVSPGLRSILAGMKLRSEGKPYVFGGDEPMTPHRARGAQRRMIDKYGAPKFTWQELRQTAGSYLANAFGIFGSASAYKSARQLGHSVTVAERYYLGLIRGIPRDARTLDEAMKIGDLLGESIGRSASPDSRTTASSA